MIDSPKWQTSIQRDLKVLLWYDKERPSSVECSMYILHPPLGLGFDVYLRIKGQTKKIGSFACPAGPDPVWLFIGTADYTQSDGPVDVVLYSSKSPAIESIDTYEVWEGGMIFKGVKVTPR
jgi:hypothetical protein